VAAVVAMAEAFAPAMLARRRGTILNVASGAAFQPMPYMTTYAATKAFVPSFSEGLWAEYRRRGVHVVVFCPDHTATPLVDALPPGCPYAAAPGADVAAMVASGLRGLERGRHYVVGGGLKAYPYRGGCRV
jgi:short-subunit dehydrogenase